MRELDIQLGDYSITLYGRVSRIQIIAICRSEAGNRVAIWRYWNDSGKLGAYGTAATSFVAKRISDKL